MQDDQTTGSTATQSRSWSLRADSRRPLPELIEDKLREFIDSGEFGPGEQLPNEPELARRMGVARSSVRTALQRLEGQRIVEVRRGRGWFVRRTDPRARTILDRLSERRLEVGELLEVRMALEGMAVSLAATRASDGDIDDIAKLSEAHVNTPASDIDRLVQTDEEFHEAVVRASRNNLLIGTYLLLVPELVEFRRATFTGRGAPARSGTEHHTVVTFLKRRDSAGARAAMMTHLLGLYHIVAADADGEHASIPLTQLIDIENEPHWPLQPPARGHE